MTKYALSAAALLVALLIVGCTSVPTPVASTGVPTPVPDTPTPQEGQIFQSFPDQIDAQQRYVIYLHGRIIEDEGPHAISPTYGAYEYEEILSALAQGGLQVIAEVRPPNTDSQHYAARVVDQVNALLEAGVPAEHITVIGFSKGGGIAIYTSSLLRNERVNFVLLAICGEEIFGLPGINLSGRVLSIYETSDDFGSCRPLAEASTGVSSFEEIALSTGRQHGAFYTADPLWLDPVIEWTLAARGG
jgi:hypothetical protein